MEQSGEPPINTDDGILAFLARTSSLHCLSAKRLSGGGANHVWRIVTTDPTTPSAPPSTLVAKHAEPFVRTLPSVALPTIRMDFEARAMRLVPSLMRDGDSGSNPANDDSKGQSVYGIRVPRVISYDADAHVLVISDGGQRTLKDAYEGLPGSSARSIGVRLGKWLARLHARSLDADIGPDGNAVGRAIYRYSYQNLQTALAGYGLGGPEGRLGKTVNEQFGVLLASDDECVAHGDFWPGNMLLEDAAVSADGDGARVGAEYDDKVTVTIVDWEITRRGAGVTDAAQFTAEAYLLDRFRGVSHGLAAAFLRSYVAETTPSKQFWIRFAVHWATHVCFWPTYVEWASQDEMRKVAMLGVCAIEMALGGEDRLEDFLLGHFDDAKQAL